jgi:uncharacterized protein (DUF433 family)
LTWKPIDVKEGRLTLAHGGESAPGIVVDPEVAHGKPVIAGTRIAVALILGQLAAGVPYDELEREYGLQKRRR